MVVLGKAACASPAGLTSPPVRTMGGGRSGEPELADLGLDLGLLIGEFLRCTGP